MGQGLGRNSPVQLTLGKDNYCALIDRHGQWCRWRIATKCACVKLPSMQPDIHCKICGGNGYLYSFQENQIVFEILMDSNAQGILSISEDNKECELIEVYNQSGKRFLAEKKGRYINIKNDKLEKGSYYTAIMRKTNVYSINECVAEKDDMGFYTVPGLTVSKPNIEGVYYEAKSDIVSIEKIIDSKGVEYIPSEFRLNQFLIKPTVQTIQDEETGELYEEEIPISEPITVKNVKYIKPFIFAILNQNISKADMQQMVEVQGDAILIYPYECDVADDDIITVLAGTYTNKQVIVRTDYETDTLGDYFIKSISLCSGIVNNNYYEFKEGKDFVLVGTNKIKWKEDGVNPDIGDAYSITYQVLPTYKVIKDIPQLRTSENQRFPKKAIVKIFTTYKENLKANVQNIYSNGVKGIY